MAQQLQIEISGKSYPCRVTMGAMRRYKLLSGQEVTDISLQSMASVAELLYCCTASACNADHVEFGLSIDDFCDAIDAAEFERLAAILAGDGGEEKKSQV